MTPPLAYLNGEFVPITVAESKQFLKFYETGLEGYVSPPGERE